MPEAMSTIVPSDKFIASERGNAMSRDRPVD